HSDDPIALSEKGHLNGSAPVYLIQKLMGIQIPSHDKVILNEEFGWGRAVTVRQHGVYVRRTTRRIKVEFASGHSVEMDTPLKETTIIKDPNPIAKTTYKQIELTSTEKQAIPDPIPPVAPDSSAKRVIIEVDTE